MVSFLETIAKVDARIFVSQTGFKYDFMSRLTLDQRQEIYKSALNTIDNYMEEHGIDRPNNWDHEYVKGYHIFNLLKRNVGFDILGFTTLDKNIFIKTRNKINSFARHHFRNDFFRKLSNYVKDIVLTDSKNHGKYVSYSEAETLVILNGFDEMMNMKGTGRENTITRADVLKVFRGNEWVLYGRNGIGGEDGKTGWFFSDKNFDDRLAEFNERKNLLKNEGLDKFVFKKYKTVYERFYLNYPLEALKIHAMRFAYDGYYSRLFPYPVPPSSLADFALLMNIDLGFWDPEF